MTDKNGVKVFEGDLVVGVKMGVIGASMYPKDKLPVLEVEYSHYCWHVWPVDMDKAIRFDKCGITEYSAGYSLFYISSSIEVVGNKWDNTELIGECE